MNTPLDLDGFVAIVDAGSVSGAARRLGQPRATLSRKRASLEDHLGVRLLQRSSRRMVLTRAGEELYRRATQIVEATRDAEDAIRRVDDVPRGLLRIAAMPASGPGLLGDLIAEFLERYPEVRVELLAETRVVDLVAEGFDIAVRGGTSSQGTLISRTLMHADGIVVASPAYLERRGTPKPVAELADHDCLLYLDANRGRHEWPLRAGGTVSVRSTHATNDPWVLLQLAIRGLGLTILPVQVIAEAVQDGRLVPVLLHEVGIRSTLSLVFAERRLLEPKVRAFIDHATAFAKQVDLHTLIPEYGSCPV